MKNTVVIPMGHILANLFASYMYVSEGPYDLTCYTISRVISEQF